MVEVAAVSENASVINDIGKMKEVDSLHPWEHETLPHPLKVLETFPINPSDESDWIVRLKTRNSDLEGDVHSETNVPFKRDTVELPDGTVVEGVFPEFESAYDTILPDELLDASDYQQSKHSNEQLKDAVDSDPELKSEFDDKQLEQIDNGETPDGYVWHHHQETGRMQLVDAETHSKTGHTGGKEIWGGGR